MNRLRREIGTWIARVLTVPVEMAPVLPVDIAALRAKLLPADVILVEGNLRISAVIKTLTQSTWSHAALYVGGEGADCVEADVVAGVRRFRLEDLRHYHVRICRPIGLNEDDRRKVIAYAASKLGTLYDLRYVFDLARYLVPLPIPKRWRRRAIALGSADPSRAICSTLIAQAFQGIGYPILPEVDEASQLNEVGRRRAREIYHIHRNGLFVPRDFDLSPFFEIIKPEIPEAFDHHKLVWVE
jgi:Permuted papain-like amidase enzyme, YaeF/YiiX, C92 family